MKEEHPLGIDFATSIDENLFANCVERVGLKIALTIDFQG